MDNLSYQPATGSTDFGPMQSTDIDLNEHYAGMAALVAAIAAAIGSVIYASKHIRHSECLGSKCDQQIILEQPVEQKRLETSV